MSWQSIDNMAGPMALTKHCGFRSIDEDPNSWILYRKELLGETQGPYEPEMSKCSPWTWLLQREDEDNSVADQRSGHSDRSSSSCWCHVQDTVHDIGFQGPPFFSFSLHSYPYFSDKKRQDYIGKEILGSWCSHAVLSDSDVAVMVGVLKTWIRMWVS